MNLPEHKHDNRPGGNRPKLLIDSEVCRVLTALGGGPPETIESLRATAAISRRPQKATGHFQWHTFGWCRTYSNSLLSAT